MINDCRAAVNFLRFNAARYNLDPNRFGAAGESSSGHLTALLGTVGDTEEFTNHPITKKSFVRPVGRQPLVGSDGLF